MLAIMDSCFIFFTYLGLINMAKLTNRLRFLQKIRSKVLGSSRTNSFGSLSWGLKLGLPYSNPQLWPLSHTASSEPQLPPLSHNCLLYWWVLLLLLLIIKFIYLLLLFYQLTDNPKFNTVIWKLEPGRTLLFLAGFEQVP